MRTVLNISLPPQMTKQFESAVKRSGHVSKSEFFRHVFREWMKNQKAISDVEKSHVEFKTGKAMKLKKVEDLWS